MNIEYNRGIIDLDSCFLQEERTNPLLMMFMYQCVNKNKEIIGITKDKLKVKNDNILKESILLSNNEPFRKAIRERSNIMCFSNNIIEALLDWRA